MATEKLATLFLNQGKKDIKNKQYEKALIHLNKSKFYIQKSWLSLGKEVKNIVFILMWKNIEELLK